ncbi:molecular chaperone [Mycoemilia scoparia]|uniref:Molecular chaperone n=1 Tax=Mycoemilia scoparia TaxID=417184 RepID=A0A9W7ZKN7_9FUNG|nr:molecular chaperone [Mycoemilia scoparia]
MEQKPFFAFSRLLQNDAHIHKFDPKMWNDLTYFDVLTGSKPTFDVDIKKLRQKFLRLQQVAHPDTFAKASDTEKGLADVLSSWINKGYSTLRNPLSRAKYLLKLEGHEITEAQKLNDPTLIMEVLEQREEVESCKSEEQLEAIRKYNSEKINETLDQLSKAFNDKDYQQAHDLTIQLQYWDNIQEAINNWSG